MTQLSLSRECASDPRGRAFHRCLASVVLIFLLLIFLFSFLIICLGSFERKITLLLKAVSKRKYFMYFSMEGRSQISFWLVNLWSYLRHLCKEEGPVSAPE